jgi:hypothetical protein
MALIDLTKKTAATVAATTNGNKTYLVVIVAMICGTLEGLGLLDMPDWVLGLLPLLGLGALRHAVAKATDAAAEAKKAGEKMKGE